MPKLPGALAAGLVAALALAGCGAAASTPPKPSGTANVAYAGSLQLVMEKEIGPAFTKKTGYAYLGQGAGALGLAQEIKAGEISPNVFISVGTGPVALIEPKFTTWAVQFASSPLVLAYYPQGPHAAELSQIAAGRRPLSDLFSLLAEPSFRLGRTDPATDPQGQDFAMIFQLAHLDYGIPSATIAADLGGGSAQIFPETSLDSQLQAGQLDAASAYRSQAIQLHLPYVSLPAAINFGDPADSGQYARASLSTTSSTVVHGFPLVLEATVVGKKDPAAAAAMVRYLLGSATSKLLNRDGYTPVPLKIVGKSGAVPATVRQLVR